MKLCDLYTDALNLIVDPMIGGVSTNIDPSAWRTRNQASIKEKAAPTPVKLAEEDYTEFDAKVEGAGTTALDTSTPEEGSRHKELLSHLCSLPSS
jgi:hypothetical protein